MQIVIKTNELIKKLEEGLIDCILSDKHLFVPRAAIKNITVDSNLTIVNLQTPEPTEGVGSNEELN